MSTALPGQILAVPLEFEFRGNVYQIANPITFGIEAAFAQWAYLTAVNEVERLHTLWRETDGATGLDEAQYNRHLDRLADRLAEGQFKWGSQAVYNKANRCWDGIKHLLFLRMQKQKNGQTVTAKLIDEIFADHEASKRLRETLNPPSAVGENKDATAETAGPAAQD